MANASNALTPDPVPDESKKKERSPSYPGVNLATAIARAKELLAEEGQNPMSVSVVATDWKMTAKSSSTLVTIAALKAYGLISDSGAGDKRRLTVTDLARRIIKDERPVSPERDAAIKTAALSPTMHRTLWTKWGNNIPSEANMRYSLIFDHKFNSNAVGDFIRNYKDTIQFAKLDESDKLPSEVEDNGGQSGTKYVPKVGDYVQWESSGILQFPEPRKVVELSPEGDFAFVEGSPTGIPVEGLIKESAPARTPPSLSATNLFRPTQKNNHVQEDVFSLAEGRVIIQWPSPLSKESIQDLKDWLQIVERKISRSVVVEASAGDAGDNS